MNIDTSKTEIVNLFNLINSAERPIKLFDETHLEVTSVTPITGDLNGFNTEIVLSAIPGHGFSGQKTYRYNRTPLPSNRRNGYTYYSNYNQALAERSLAESQSFAPGGSSLDYSDLPPTAGDPARVVGTAAEDSLLYHGTANYVFVYSDKKTIRNSDIPSVMMSTNYGILYDGAPWTGYQMDGTKTVQENLVAFVNELRESNEFVAGDLEISYANISYQYTSMENGRYECQLILMGGQESDYAYDSYESQTFHYPVPSMSQLLGGSTSVQMDSYVGESILQVIERFCLEHQLPSDSLDPNTTAVPGLGETSVVYLYPVSYCPFFNGGVNLTLTGVNPP